MTSLHIDGMKGFGDNLYQVPVIRMIREKEKGLLYLTTPWPQFYLDIPNLRFVNPNTILRTQAKNADNFRDYVKPPLCRKMRMTYTPTIKSGLPIYKGLLHSVHLANKSDSYFLFLSPRVDWDSNTALIRPVTYRKEWPARARGPKPEYIQWAID